MMFEHHFDRLYRAIAQIISNQGVIMADLAAVQTAVANLTTAIQSLEAKEQNAPPSVLQSDLDPIVTSLESLTTSINNLLNPPAA